MITELVKTSYSLFCWTKQLGARCVFNTFGWPFLYTFRCKI